MNELMTGDSLDAGRNGPLEAAAPPIESGASRLRATSWWPVAIGALTATALAGALVAGTLPRLHAEKELKAAAEEVSTSLPRVTVVTAQTATFIEGAESVRTAFYGAILLSGLSEITLHS